MVSDAIFEAYKLENDARFAKQNELIDRANARADASSLQLSLVGDNAADTKSRQQLLNHPAVLAYNSIGRLVLKQQVEHVAQLVANLDLICVKFHQVDDKPPGASALLEEAVFAIRGGELMITAARVAGGPLAGQRAHEVMRAYFSAMEPSIKSGENKTLLDVNGQARDSAIKVGKRLEKDALLAKEKEDLAKKAATQPPRAAPQAQNFQQYGQQFSQNKRFHSNH